MKKYLLIKIMFLVIPLTFIYGNSVGKYDQKTMEFLVRSFKTEIDKNPNSYFSAIKILKEDNAQELIEEIKKALPSLEVWKSVLDKNPGKWSNLIVDLKKSGDEEMVKALQGLFYNEGIFKSKMNSITKIISQRIHIDYRMSEKYKVSPELIKQFIETLLYESLKDNDIVFDILYALALSIENDPVFGMYIFDKKMNLNNLMSNENLMLGSYSEYHNTITISNDFNEIAHFKGSLIHEITHKLMDVLYKNHTNPYRLTDSKAKNAYANLIKNLELKLNQLQKKYGDLNGDINTGNELYDYTIRCFMNIKKYSKTDQQICEYIVRYPQLIAAEKYGDKQVRELMQPLADYWNQYVLPDIRNYIDKHGRNTQFISSWEQETITTPFVLNEKDASGVLYQIEKEKAKELEDIDLMVWESLIAENPMNYFYIILEEKDNKEKLIRIKKLLPSLEVWRSVISKNPKQRTIIVSFLKKSGDIQMAKALEAMK